MAQPKSLLATESIARDILKNTIPTGSYLKSENELADSTGVSRTSVRSALQTLASKGLISIIPKVGSIANPPESWNWLDEDVLAWVTRYKESDTFISHLLEVRLMVEPNAAALAAANATGENLAAIEKSYNEMAEGLKQDDRDMINNGDIAFHTQLLVATKNPFLISLGNALSTALAVSFSRTLEDNVTLSEPALKEHYAVMDAIRMRDSNKARQLMQDIVSGAITKTVKSLESTQYIQ